MDARTPQKTLLAVLAHPDDEVFGTGGILAKYASEGARTILVTCTGGEVGEISHASLATPENLDVVRAAELAEAARILGISQTIPLGYRDSGMAGTADNEHPDSFHQADLAEATSRLVRIIRAERPWVIIAPNEQGDYGHPDHVKANRVAVAAFEATGDGACYPEAGPPWQPSKLYVSAFPRSGVERWSDIMRQAGVESPFTSRTFTDVDGNPIDLMTPDDQVTTEIDVAAFAEKKRDALFAHRTQFGDDHFFRRLPEDLMQQLWTHESFRLVRGRVTAPAGERETDLFAGL
jgi:N-acetyl-1-D-myo-inositol-2-amino-2-deoxy-alpha-D-glucopyranoside deacetylase